ncbi:unnamed protein product [Parascedosporium putredinis]|uniref:Uncharacterized protein n=1 Tax=Parascedosporium putredinis TaxID=1442378 RepID=A0A9P1GYN3_9PEZI|nr:unnamed protein product [Parascedosporium putredinis]CAI7990908.1 unnamed protein product [Parascedosporium putredinis]
MDDYLSSEDELDGESILVPKRQKKPDDEGLLFNDSGYGFRGPNFQAIPEIPYESPPKSPQFLRQPYSNPASLYRDPIQRTYGVETDDDEDLRSFEKDTHSIGDITARVKAMRAALYEAIAEEKAGKVDVKMAVRMRKEAKAKKRASTMSLTRRSKAPSGVEVDDGHHADVE